jgi:Zn-dependent protease/predicted transcriptional regulator
MFGKSVTLFKLFGFAVRVDISWIVIAALITWSLAQGFFPFQYRNLSPAAYWWMGIAGALGLFASIIFHEMSHSLVARRYHLAIQGITLFIFGGVAEMSEEPKNPKTEFLMAIAGPISSLVLAGGFYLLFLLGLRNGWPTPIRGVIAYLSFINIFLAVFNLIPAFPLDGGRVFRSILWGWKKDIQWATRIASAFGTGFGFLLILLGGINVLQGNGVGGIWQILIGMFLVNAAKMSYQRVVVRNTLKGEPVRRLMRPDPIAVAPSTSIEQLVEDYIYRYHFKMFPVVEEGRVVGCIDINRIKEVPRAKWPDRRVRELMRPCSAENTISSDLDATQALAQMNRTHSSRLMVMDGERLVGVLSLKDLLSFLSVKSELEDSEEKAA